MPNDISGILSSSQQAQSNYEKYKDKYVDSTKELVNSETFMQLLVAEMTNQDPLEPTSNTEFISQLATFSQMQYARDSSTYAMANYAASLVGKTATASKMDGKNLVTKTGVVESVTKNSSNNSYTVKIDGESFDLSKITAVKDTEKDSTSDGTDGLLNSTNALGDSIARASSMVGMYASVSKTENGVTTEDEGFIASIRIKDGVISAVINDRVYALADITEVTYATVIEDDTQGGEQDFISNEEETVLQMGAIIPDKKVEDIADLADEEEEEQITAVQGIEG
ncbi:MAG: flagellar hook capping protein [Oscillospiraceae bacterium]|nr:flagellar hook capping protein [Oscillospiraceae bacterium]